MRPFLPVFSVSLAYNTEFVAVFSVPGPEAVGMEQEGIFPSLSQLSEGDTATSSGITQSC